MRSEETLGESKTPYLKLEIINNVKFTQREIDVIACVLAGRGSKTIASLLTIAPKTVEAHIHNIMGKITCSSREDIINFIEKSDKSLFLRQIYQDLLLKSDFRKTLIAISTLLRNKMLPQVIIYQYELSESEIIFTYNLEEHFKLIGIPNINRIEKDSFFPLKWDDINCHIIHIVSEELTKKLQENIIEESTIQYKFIDVILQNPTNHTLLLLDKNISILPQEFLRIDYVSFKAQNSHYLVVLEVLRRIIGKVNIDLIISNLKKNLSLVSEKPEKLFSNKVSSTEEFAVRKNIFPPIKKIFIENKISILIAFIIFSIVVLISYYSFQKSQKSEVFCLKPQKSIIFIKNLTTWNIPRQNHVFVGREKLLSDLHNKLHQNHTPETTSNLAISACAGLGGIGKTQLALQYVNHTKHPYTLKVWFPAENVDYLYNKYVEFAKLLGYTEVVYTKESIIAYVKQWLIDNPGWLLVFDNVNNYREIEPFLPEAGGYVILTTRQRHWSTKFAILPIDIMTEQEAIKTIKTLIQRDIAKEQNAIKELVEVLGYLPLALVQAGAYIKQKHITVPEYLDLYKRYESELLADNTFLDETTTYNYPVAITWNISLEAIVRDTKINNEPPIAIELLTVAAYLAPDKISRKLLLKWLQIAYPHLLSPRLTLNKHIDLLWQYSMINYDDNDNIAIHRLVQAVLRHQINQVLDSKNNIYSSLNLRWFKLLLRFFIDNEHEFKLTNSFQQLIETSQQFKNKFKDKYNKNLAAMDLMISSVYFYQEKYEDFLKILDEVNTYLQKTNGLEMLKCKILYLYSAYYLKTGNYQKAEEKINKAFYEYNNIKISKSEKDNDVKILKAKLLCNKVNLVLAKNNVNKTTDKININTLAIESSTKSIQEAIALFKETHNTIGFLRSIRLYGKLLILTNQVDKVIIEFTKYNNLIEHIADDRTRMLFYITYSDAYFSKGDFNKALEYCGKAKQQAEKLHLNNALNKINNKEKVIKGNRLGNPVYKKKLFESIMHP